MYSAALDRFGMTEDNADQLRALEVLRGEIDGKSVTLPWLASVRLLVLDGFFDFTPVQGEMLRLLIPQVPEVIVNLNFDERNAEIFRPFYATIDQLSSIATFETKLDTTALSVPGVLSPLRVCLFNPVSTAPAEDGSESSISILDCANRQTEIRAIAKRIKQLVLLDGYSLEEIVLVVRELSSYAETISRVFEEEAIPCSLRRRVQLTEVPSARAAVKLFELLVEYSRQGAGALKVNALADVLKSGYFRLSESELDSLRERFSLESQRLLGVAGYRRGPVEASVGQWDVDELENVIAFVGAELRVERWLDRAQRLTARVPTAEPEDLGSDDEDESDSEESGVEATNEPRAEKRSFAGVEIVDVPLPGSERKPKPARDIHPASIAWSALVVKRLRDV